MSAPTLPRYRVGSVSGYAISDEGLVGNKTSKTFWYVYDSWCNYAIVAEFKRGNTTRWGVGQTAEQRARALADKLEQRHAKGEPPERERKPRSTPQHGTISGYTNLPCRCKDCREANQEYHRAYKAGRRIYRPRAAK